MVTLLLLMMLAQVERPIDLDRERRLALYGEGSPHMLITVKAEYLDGRPMFPGTIGCTGYWYKHVDEQTKVWAWMLPFSTDSRGAIGLNPLAYYDDEEPYVLTCEAMDAQKRSATRSFVISNHGVYTIQLGSGR